MTKIKQTEDIIVHENAEEFILDVCNNVAKVLINYMEKFKLLQTEITLELATSVCTNISFNTFVKYTNHLRRSELNEAIQLLYSIYDRGYSVMDILDNYFLFIKTTNILTEDEKYEIIPILCKYITIFHNVHEDDIELPLFTNNILCTLIKKADPNKPGL